MNIPQLNDSKIEIGFTLLKLESDSLVLRYQGNLVCLIGSPLNVTNEMLNRLCEAYLEKLDS